jgi:hypothetical protein
MVKSLTHHSVVILFWMLVISRSSNSAGPRRGALALIWGWIVIASAYSHYC